jgi:hypothetical protein
MQVYIIPESTQRLMELENMSQNIFSEDKNTRKHYRQLIISNYHDFWYMPELTEFQKTQYSHFYVVAHAFSLFINKSEFLFKIKEKDAGDIVLHNRRNAGVHTSLPVNSDQPTYMVTMLHLVRKENLDKQLELLKEEGFGVSKEESLRESATRLHAFVGLNYCHGFDCAENRANKMRINGLLSERPKPNVSYESFHWTPQWVYNIPKAKGKNPWPYPDLKSLKLKWLFPISKQTTKVPQSIAKRLFRLLQDAYPHYTPALYQKIMEDKVVPYQGLREAIKNSPSVQLFFNAFRFYRWYRPCYLATTDDDAVKLRNDGKGVFTHYDDLIKTYPNLELASTGYFMVDPKNHHVEVASRVNLVARQGCFLMPNAAYPPEPNMIVKIPFGPLIDRKISFLRDKAGNLESLGMLQNLGLMAGDVRGRVVFGNAGAIQTGVSPNVKIPKKLLKGVTPQSYLQSDVVDSLRQFSQSAISPIFGFGMNVMRTIPRIANNVISRPILAEIYQAFDLIDYAKILGQNWAVTYLPIAEKIELIYFHGLPKKFIGRYGEYCDMQAENIVADVGISKEFVKPISNMIMSTASNLYSAKLRLVDLKFTEAEVSNIIRLSTNINENVYYYLKDIVNKPTF